MNSLGADLPTSSHTCSKALDTQEKRINSAMQMAPIGSRYHTKRSPTTDMIRPKMLTAMSFRWSIWYQSAGIPEELHWYSYEEHMD